MIANMRASCQFIRLQDNASFDSQGANRVPLLRYGKLS